MGTHKEYIEPLDLFGELVRRRPDRGEIGQVTLNKLDLGLRSASLDSRGEPGDGLISLIARAAKDDDVGAVLEQGLTRLFAGAAGNRRRSTWKSARLRSTAKGREGDVPDASVTSRHSRGEAIEPGHVVGRPVGRGREGLSRRREGGRHSLCEGHAGRSAEGLS
jgi:hypothetical protein